MKVKLDEYIAVRAPSIGIGSPQSIVHIVITRIDLALAIDRYLDGEIERDCTIPAALDLFNYLLSNRKRYFRKDAIARAKYLNKKKYKQLKELNNRRFVESKRN